MQTLKEYIETYIEESADKYKLYADTMKSHNSDFMADFEDGIKEENIKKLLKYRPDEALLGEETVVSMEDITKKGEIVLNKEGYIFVRQKNNQHDFFVYKTIEA